MWTLVFTEELFKDQFDHSKRFKDTKALLSFIEHELVLGEGEEMFIFPPGSDVPLDNLMREGIATSDTTNSAPDSTTYNKKWVREALGYTLYFFPYHEGIEVIYIWQDVDGGWLYRLQQKTKGSSNLLNATTLEEAKREAETLVQEYYIDRKNYFSFMSQRFYEGKERRY